MRRKHLLPIAMTAFLLVGLSGKEAWPAWLPSANGLAGWDALARGIVLSSAQVTAPAAPIATGEKATQPQGLKGEPLVVSGITIAAGPNGETFVDIATTKAGGFRVSELDNPRRLVLDFDGARKGLRGTMFPSDSALITGVRVGQFQLDPAIVRVVADLLGDPRVDVHARSGGVRIELKARGTATARVRPAGKPIVAQISPPVATAPSSTVEAETLGDSEPSRTVRALPTPSLAEMALPRPIIAEESPAALKLAPALDPESMRSEHAAEVLSASLTPEEQVQAGGTEAPPEQPKYTGEPISVNLKDVDLKDFFRLIHEISGLNIIIDPNVIGSVTMVLDNVPWDQALDIVLKNNNLGKALEGNVLRIAKVETLTAEQTGAAKLVEARIDAQPLVTKFLPVNYAKAVTIAGLLKTWIGGGALSKRGTVLVDERTNTLIVSDIATQIPLITKVVAQLDTKSKQVSIEARVVLATNNFERDISTVLAYQYNNRSATTATGAATSQTSNGTATGSTSVSPSTITPFTPGGIVKSTAASGFGVWAIANQGANYIINAAIALAETTDQAKIISSPYIVTQNNTVGSVIQGVQIPYQTTINNTVSVQFIQASLQMTVTPQVTQDGNIFLIINVNNASPGALVLGVGTAINNQLATTQVLVPDGGTVVFGGVKVTNTEAAASYVPGLGKIPVLGRLFKSTKATDNKTDLMFFVTPKVLPG